MFLLINLVSKPAVYRHFLTNTGFIEKHEKHGFYRSRGQQNHLWISKCSKYWHHWSKRQNSFHSSHNQVRNRQNRQFQCFSWFLNDTVNDTAFEDYSSIEDSSVDHSCTLCLKVSKSVKHFRNRSQSSQTFRSEHFSSVRWPKTWLFSDFHEFSWI